MGRPLSVMAHLKKSVIAVKAVDSYLAHALKIAIAIVDNDANYKSHRDGWKIRPVVRNVLEKTGIDLSIGARIPELVRYQERFREYKIFVHEGLSSDNIMFEGLVESAKRLNLLYDDVKMHYHVITNLTAAWQNSKSVKRVAKDAQVTLRTFVIRRVATVWQAPRAGSKAFEYPATNATGTLEVGCVSTVISNIQPRKILYVSVGDVALRVED